MNKMIGWSIIGVVAFLGINIGVYFMTTLNREASLNTTKVAKQLDNTSELDNLKKKISQTVQISEKQFENLKSIIVGNAEARSSGGNTDAIMTWVQESVPTVDTSVYNNLINIITSSRDAWTMRQKELIDIDREHRLMYNTYPSKWVLTIIGRKPSDIIVITSTDTEEIFKSGKDDDVKLF